MSDFVLKIAQGCAFPQEWKSGPSNSTVTAHGLSKREYFAGLAMQGYLAHPEVQDTFKAVEWSVKAADALLAELAREKP